MLSYLGLCEAYPSSVDLQQPILELTPHVGVVTLHLAPLLLPQVHQPLTHTQHIGSIANQSCAFRPIHQKDPTFNAHMGTSQAPKAGECSCIG